MDKRGQQQSPGRQGTEQKPQQRKPGNQPGAQPKYPERQRDDTDEEE